MEEKIRILIVEDREEHQNLLKRIVNKLGFEYELATSVEESKSKLLQYSFHVALVDLSLEPDNDKNRDGLVILQHIKNSNEGTAALVLTAYGDVIDADKTFTEYAVAGFIPKVADVTTIMNRITSAVELAKLERKKPSRRVLNTLVVLDHPIVSSFSQEGDSVEKNLRLRQELDGFLKRLLLDFYPLIPKKKDFIEARDHQGRSFIEINYWSKILGKAITICIWKAKDSEFINEYIRSITEGNFEEFRIEEIINEVFDKRSFPNFEGIGFTRKDNNTSDFI